MVQELMVNVDKLESENRLLAQSLLKSVSQSVFLSNHAEESIPRDRKQHDSHLEHLEAEMDQQVKEVELRVKERAAADLVAERKSIREIMKEEMDELNSHLKMFQRVSRQPGLPCPSVYMSSLVLRWKRGCGRTRVREWRMNG